MASEFGPEYDKAKKQWLDDDGWLSLDAQLEATEQAYRKNEETEEIFGQTDEILSYGHFNDRLAYPVFAIGRLLHSRIRFTDASTSEDSDEFSKPYHDRMARARDMLLGAAALLDGEEEVDLVVDELLDRLNDSKGQGATTKAAPTDGLEQLITDVYAGRMDGKLGRVTQVVWRRTSDLVKKQDRETPLNDAEKNLSMAQNILGSLGL